MDKDIRWHQRFSNYRKALAKLTRAITVIQENVRDGEDEDEETYTAIQEMLKEGLIQRFEYTHELAWNVMKDYAEYQGNFEIKGSRDATREAFGMKLINNGDVWMEMIRSRNDTSHTYNDETAEKIYTKIIKDYYQAFTEFEKNMERLRSGDQAKLFES
jgi:nucleotidyltransferase substrate binding protein (TIGR01987 family)